MRGGTLFSGIGVPELAAPGIDWRWCAEIDPFAAAVHAARHPGIPNLGDVTEIDPNAIEPVDIIVFGSPCQSFSNAGKRLGLDDPRGNLALIALDVARRLRPRWFAFENVPGLLSSSEGRDFGLFLRAVEECGYSGVWRVLDAQFAGVAQRRRRVFFVGHFGDWRPAAKVLLEPESLRGDTPPRREAGADVAGPIGASIAEGRATNIDAAGTFVPVAFKASHYTRGKDGAPSTIAPPLTAEADRADQDTLIAFDTTQITSAENRSNPQPGDPAPSLARTAHPPTVAYNIIPGTGTSNDLRASEATVSTALTARQIEGQNDRGTQVVQDWQVRRLTVLECERLQGLPDHYTLIPWKSRRSNKHGDRDETVAYLTAAGFSPADAEVLADTPDGPRYRCIGNAMSERDIGWILGRIYKVDAEASRAAPGPLFDLGAGE